MVYGPIVNLETCTGCNQCVMVCPANILYEASEKKQPPLVKYPDECHYDYLCMDVCPVKPSAIKLVHPLDMRLSLKRVK